LPTAELALVALVLVYAFFGWGVIFFSGPAGFPKAGGRLGRTVFVDSVYVATVAIAAYAIMAALGLTVVGVNGYVFLVAGVCVSFVVGLVLNVIVDLDPVGLYVESFIFS
jgi:hypothetical protein